MQYECILTFTLTMSAWQTFLRPSWKGPGLPPSKKGPLYHDKQVVIEELSDRLKDRILSQKSRLIRARALSPKPVIKCLGIWQVKKADYLKEISRGCNLALQTYEYWTEPLCLVFSFAIQSDWMGTIRPYCQNDALHPCYCFSFCGCTVHDDNEFLCKCL